MHQIKQLIYEIEKTHKGLGRLIAMNILTAKAKKTILNVAPAGCGKSTATDTVAYLLKDKARKYSSLTLAGLKHLRDELTECNAHIIIDDLGQEKSLWSRISTITVLANLTYTHYVRKITQSYEIEITNFYGSASLNIQPVLMNALVQEQDWIAVVRDKVLRYYHLIRPVKPKRYIQPPSFNWGLPTEAVKPPKHKGKLWYQLIAIGLTQWSYARCLEHIPDYLKALAALDNRTEVTTEDYRLLIKLLQPMQLERYILRSFGLEEGRVFDNNVYCLLVEIASHGNPTVETICEDYKVSPATVLRVAKTAQEWVWVKKNSPTRICPTEQTKQILELCGYKRKW